MKRLVNILLLSLVVVVLLGCEQKPVEVRYQCTPGGKIVSQPSECLQGMSAPRQQPEPPPPSPPPVVDDDHHGFSPIDGIDPHAKGDKFLPQGEWFQNPINGAQTCNLLKRIRTGAFYVMCIDSTWGCVYVSRLDDSSKKMGKYCYQGSGTLL